jgi:hypothetical protein
MLNPDTKSIIQSRDIIWLNEVYHDWIAEKVSQKKEIDDDDDDVITNLKIQAVNNDKDKLKGSQDQDELKKKRFTGLCVC